MSKKDSLFKIDVVPKEILTDLLGPSAKGIGQGLGGIVNFIIGPLRKLNVINEKSYEDFIQKVNHKSNPIPESERDSSKLGIALKIMEDARFQLNEEQMREYFANLLSNSIDKRKNENISPRFSSILLDLSVKDATFLKKIYSAVNSTVPLSQIKFSDGKFPGIEQMVAEKVVLFTDEFLVNPMEFDILYSLGLIKYDSDAALSSKYYQDIYLKFSVSELYNSYTKQLNNLRLSNPNENLKEINKYYGYIKLTELGSEFCKRIF